MNDAEKFDLAKRGLRFCPECGKRLEQHPNNVNAMSCFLDGDFQLLWVEGGLQVRWRATRMIAAYARDARSDQMRAVDNRLRAASMVSTDPKEILLIEIAKLYNRGAVTFLEATQMIVDAETGEHPNEPTVEQCQNARVVLDRIFDDKVKTANPQEK